MSLFKLVEDLVDSVIGQIGNQANWVEAAISGPLKKWAAEVDNGGLWEGNGANRLVQELNTDMIPRLAEVMELTTGFAVALNKGEGRMKQAIDEANKKASTLLGLANRIF